MIKQKIKINIEFYSKTSNYNRTHQNHNRTQKPFPTPVGGTLEPESPAPSGRVAIYINDDFCKPFLGVPIFETPNRKNLFQFH